MKLTLIRGVPGTGKSTLANKIAHETGASHFEADMYFERNGSYHYDPSQIGNAHEWCKTQVQEALNRGKAAIVSNTFTRFWEMAEYYNMACQHGISIEVITLTHEYGSVHNVPAEAMKRMRQRMQIPKE